MVDTARPEAAARRPGAARARARPRRGAGPRADGTPLTAGAGAARVTRGAQWRAFLLVAPLLAFVLVTFVVPIGQMLHRSVEPRLLRQHAEPRRLVRGEPARHPARRGRLRRAGRRPAARQRGGTIGTVGTRINYEISGTRSLFTSAGGAPTTSSRPSRGAADLDETGATSSSGRRCAAPRGPHDELLRRGRRPQARPRRRHRARRRRTRASTCRCSGAPCCSRR
jgi:hypothetical protein